MNKKSALNVFLIFSLVFTIILLYSCKQVSERPYVNSLNNINYGEIHMLGDILFISIESYDSIPLDTILKFTYCLKKKEVERNRDVSLIKIYRYHYYIDQIKPSDLLLLVQFKYEPNLQDYPTIRIADVVRFENSRSILVTNYSSIYNCSNE